MMSDVSIDPAVTEDRPPVAVIVVNYGSHALLRDNLPHAAQWPGARIVVVDNRSDTAERVAITRLAGDRQWELVTLPDNGGFARGVNAGARRARDLGCTGVVLVNPDASVPVGVIDALREQVHDDPSTVVSPYLVDSTGSPVFTGSDLDLRSGHLGDGSGAPRGATRPWLTGACLAVSLELFERLGGFDERYFLYWEDVDFSYRALVAGARLVVRADLVVVHDEGGTQGRTGRAKSAVYYRYNARNRLRFAANNLTRADIVRWMLRTPAESTEILLRGGRRQLVESPWPAVAIVRGSLEGLGLALVALLRRRRR